MFLNSDSPLNEHPSNINIKLRNHQLAMLKRCIDIEEIKDAKDAKDNIFGIMNDKPGTGKTYVILALINHFKNNLLNKETNKETNIIIVPQNIYSQWVLSIEKFSQTLTYNKFINYENIISLYMNTNILKDTDIILTTSSYYHIIATTLSSLDIKISRIFFDEIDSISNIISTKINADFIWFVSATFNIEYLGYYGNKLKNNNINIDNITCKCENNFIDENIYLDPPIKKYYLCKNIYVDNILECVVTKKELKGLNAMNFTLNKKEFIKNKVNNEKEVIDMIIKSRKSNIDFNKYQLEESAKLLEHYNNCINNSNKYNEEYNNKIKTLDKVYSFKEYIVNFVSNFQNFILLDVFKDEFRQKGVQSLKIVLDDIIDICYNINEIDRICLQHLNNKKNSLEIDMITMNIKKLNVIIGNIIENMKYIKEEDTEVLNLCEILEDNKKYFEDLLQSINSFSDLIKAPHQIEINEIQKETSTKLIDDNQYKINLIYSRLIENKCCPVCYELFSEVNNNSIHLLDKNNSNQKIYYTSKCCNNKICENCIDEWYNLNKTSCIFCNTSDIIKDDLIFYETNNNNNDNNNLINNSNIDNNLINNLDISFETYNFSKADFLNNYIELLKEKDSKVIIFSDYSSVFQYIENICNKNEIKYVDLDKGNIKDIDTSVNDYKFGKAKILLSNSTLFGCGMNFENANDILFVHKMDKDMEKQVIGRAQRLGRKSVLNIIYLEYENESEFTIKKRQNSGMFIEYDNDNENDNDNDEINNELEKYYKNKQIASILENIQDINFDDISGNEISCEINDMMATSLSTSLSTSIENMSTSIENIGINNDNNNNDNDIDNDNIYSIPDEPIDINLEELIRSLG